MSGMAWTLNKEDARQDAPRTSVQSRLVKWIARKAYSAGYERAIHDLAVGKLREHIAGATRPKKRFATEQHALDFIAFTGHGHAKTYQCGICGDWHIATVKR